MRVCYFGIYSAAPVYPRNNNIIKGLREAGVVVDECRVSLEESHASRAAVVKSKARMLGFLVGLIKSYFSLFFRLRKLPRPDLFVVGHPGYFLQGFFIQIRTLVTRCTNPDGIDDDRIFFGHICGIQRQDVRPRIHAIGQQQHYFCLNGVSFEHSRSLGNCFSQVCHLSGHTDICFVKDLFNSTQIGRERGLDISTRSEKDETHSIPFSFLNKFVHYIFDGIPSPYFFSVSFPVFGCHAERDIGNNKKVTGGFNLHLRFSHKLR